jgi:putative transposase
MHVYRGPVPCSITIACEKRAPILRETAVVEMCLACLRWAAQKHCIRVYAYCFMPDHVHLLVQGGPASFIPDFVHDFKGKSALLFARARHRGLWQETYHDRVLRTWEGLLEVARYISANPVRAGLVQRPADYPHLGSFEWDRNMLVEA